MKPGGAAWGERESMLCSVKSLNYEGTRLNHVTSQNHRQQNGSLPVQCHEPGLCFFFSAAIALNICLSSHLIISVIV